MDDPQATRNYTTVSTFAVSTTHGGRWSAMRMMKMAMAESQNIHRSTLQTTRQAVVYKTVSRNLSLGVLKFHHPSRFMIVLKLAAH
jgi:hypothetical protein